MRSVIVYTRVSTLDQKKSGFGTDAQLVEIRAFAKASGMRLKKIFREAATAMGEQDTGERPELDKAMALAIDRSWPIIVATQDRLSRNQTNIVDWVLDDRIKIFSARLGEHATDASIISQAARDQFDGEEKSRRTKEALRIKKLAGAELGNRTNFPFVQSKGSAKNGKNAKLRLGEFAEALEAVDPLRELTAKQIADALNAVGFKPAQSAKWTSVNIGRVLSNLKASAAHEIRVKALLASSPSMFEPDGKLTVEGADRWRNAKNTKMIESKLDADLTSALASNTLTDAHRRWIENWVVDIEAGIMGAGAARRRKSPSKPIKSRGSASSVPG